MFYSFLFIFKFSSFIKRNLVSDTLSSYCINIIPIVNGKYEYNFELFFSDNKDEIKSIRRTIGSFSITPHDWLCLTDKKNISIRVFYGWRKIEIPIPYIYIEKQQFILYINTCDQKQNKKMFKSFNTKRDFYFTFQFECGNIKSVVITNKN